MTTSAGRFARSAQRLVRHFASGKTVTLKSKARTRLGEEPISVPAAFPPLTVEERMGLEAGTQTILIAVADLGSFVLDGSCMVTVGSRDYPFTPTGGPGVSPPTSELGDSRSMITGYVQLVT